MPNLCFFLFKKSCGRKSCATWYFLAHSKHSQYGSFIITLLLDSGSSHVTGLTQ